MRNRRPIFGSGILASLQHVLSITHKRDQHEIKILRRQIILSYLYCANHAHEIIHRLLEMDNLRIHLRGKIREAVVRGNHDCQQFQTNPAVHFASTERLADLRNCPTLRKQSPSQVRLVQFRTAPAKCTRIRSRTTHSRCLFRGGKSEPQTSTYVTSATSTFCLLSKCRDVFVHRGHRSVQVVRISGDTIASDIVLRFRLFFATGQRAGHGLKHRKQQMVMNNTRRSWSETIIHLISGKSSP